MTPFNLILAATDFSAPANNAVWRAAQLARQHGARLRIVHVVNPAAFVRVREWLAPSVDLDAKAAEGRDRLRKLSADVRQLHGVVAEIELRTGDTFQELHRAATRADLLVVGQRRRNPLIELVLGRTAQRLVEACRRPVLVVRQAADGGYRRILVPIDLTPASDAAAVVAAALAPDVDLHIFHAFAWPGEAVMREADVRESVIRDARAREEAGLIARMRRSMARLGLDSRRMSFALGRGSPVAATLRQAQALGADVLVATKHRRSRVGATVLGRVNSLLLRARCDMLIVPGRVRDPRQPRAPVQRLPLARTSSAGSARATGLVTAPRAPSWAPAQAQVTTLPAADRRAPRLAGWMRSAATSDRPLPTHSRPFVGQTNRRTA
jgi:nucleotide-binding universal stress UspA family protein